MSVQKKPLWSETGRWLRVGTLTITTFGPLMSRLLPRLLEQVRKGEDFEPATDRQPVVRHIKVDDANTNLLVQEKLQTLGTALLDSLNELRDRPYSQEMLKRTEMLSEAVRERSRQLAHDLAERSSDFSQEVAKRGQQVTQELSEQKKGFWIALGFGVGLVVTGLVTFKLVRQRLQQPLEDEEVIELSSPSTKNGASNIPVHNEPVFLSQKATNDLVTSQPVQKSVEVPLADIQLDPFAYNIPDNAIFVGVVESKRYYPVANVDHEHLTRAHGRAVDVMYFSSEDEARAQGFKAAD